MRDPPTSAKLGHICWRLLQDTELAVIHFLFKCRLVMWPLIRARLMSADAAQAWEKSRNGHRATGATHITQAGRDCNILSENIQWRLIVCKNARGPKKDCFCCDPLLCSTPQSSLRAMKWKMKHYTLESTFFCELVIRSRCLTSAAIIGTAALHCQGVIVFISANSLRHIRHLSLTLIPKEKYVAFF